jgi:stalled ribosome rescue protein Dom34
MRRKVKLLLQATASSKQQQQQENVYCAKVSTATANICFVRRSSTCSAHKGRRKTTKKKDGI